MSASRPPAPEAQHAKQLVEQRTIGEAIRRHAELRSGHGCYCWFAVRTFVVSRIARRRSMIWALRCAVPDSIATRVS